MAWREPIKVVADILSHELNLSSDRIFIYNDGRPLPKDDGLYISLCINETIPYANNSKTGDINTTFSEKISMNYRQKVIASVISKDSTARIAAYNAVMALSSVYSIQKQEEYSCHIAKIAHVTDASFLEETARLNRFDVAINVISWAEATKEIDYFNTGEIETRFEP